MKNLLIVYPGGCGGNHLSNLISTHKKFNKFFDSTNYLSDLLAHYERLHNVKLSVEFKNTIKDETKFEAKGINCHFSETYILNKNSLDTLSKDHINILAQHDHAYYELETDYQLISKIPKPFWIVMSFPKQNTIPYQRIKLCEFTPRSDRYTFPFYCIGSGQPAHYPKADYSNGAYLNTEDFFTESGYQLVEDILKINLPIEAKQMHHLWYNKMCKILSLFDMLPK
jgi:hypothetical protein